MITVATTFYITNHGVPEWAKWYTMEWVEKLYRGIERNYSRPFRFVALTDRIYDFAEPIEQIALKKPIVWNAACLQLHEIEADTLVTMGLDTVIVGNLDELFAYNGKLAVPRDPYHPNRPCNGVTIGKTNPILANTKGLSDMEALHTIPFEYLDDLFPGKVLSYKVHVHQKPPLTPNASIVYFHGDPKQHQIEEEWVKSAWK